MFSVTTGYEEYLRPLAAVGLAAETINQQFYATVFGGANLQLVGFA